MERRIIMHQSPLDSQIMTGTLFIPDKPKALVIIFHGMAEHRHRYIRMAEQLAAKNYLVLTIDHRGHGESLYDKTVKGYFADNNGWFVNLEDLHSIVKEVTAEFPLPEFLLGHSMGSLVARSYLKRFESELDGVYLSGSPAKNPMADAGLMIARLTALVRGKKHPSKLLNSMSFGSFNKAIVNPKTPMDWLSCDPKNVSDYNNDPLCGFVFTAQGFADSLVGMKDVYSSEGWHVVRPNLPIKFISGQEDPCWHPGGLAEAVQYLSDVGYQRVEKEYVEGCRHEIFNDVKRTEVLDGFIKWLDSQCRKLGEKV